MGNCQAIDNATLVIQHPSGRADKLYWPVTAAEIMKTNPGHYVALLLTTTTFCPSTAAATTTAAITTVKSTIAAKSTTTDQNNNNSSNTVRVTRIKLLRPTDTLILGQVYRLITNQEVMKGLNAKKHAKMKMNHPELINKHERMKQKPSSDSMSVPTESEMEKNKQVHKQEKHRHRSTAKSTNSGSVSKSRSWQPKLMSISEATS